MVRRGYIDLAERQLHYRRAGDPTAPLLVLLHQTPSTSAMYEPLMAALAPRFDLLALDTPGFGQSDPLPGRFSIPAAAAQIAAAVHRLRPGPAFWFGHHTGAALALQVADDQPDRVKRLAMSGPCLLNDNLRDKLPQIAAPIPAMPDGSHLQALWQRISGKDSAVSLSSCQRDVIAGATAGSAYPEAYRSVCELDTAKQLQALRCPTLVFAGSLDPLYGQLDAAYRLLAQGQKAEIAGARSFVCELHLAQVASLLNDFFGEPDV